MVWLYRSTNAVRKRVFFLLAEIFSTCLRGSYRKGRGETLP